MNKMTLYRHSDIGFVLRDTIIDLGNFDNVPIISLSYLLAKTKVKKILIFHILLTYTEYISFYMLGDVC